MGRTGKYGECRECGRRLDEFEHSWTCFKCRHKRLMDEWEAREERENYEPDRNPDGSLRELGT